MFLFSFYTAGIRFSDIYRLKWENIVENEIVYTMHKSKARAGAKRTLPLVPKAISIVARYKGRDPLFVFPHPSGIKPNSLSINLRF